MRMFQVCPFAYSGRQGFSHKPHFLLPPALFVLYFLSPVLLHRAFSWVVRMWLGMSSFFRLNFIRPNLPNFHDGVGMERDPGAPFGPYDFFCLRPGVIGKVVYFLYVCAVFLMCGAHFHFFASDMGCVEIGILAIFRDVIAALSNCEI